MQPVERPIVLYIGFTVRTRLGEIADSISSAVHFASLSVALAAAVIVRLVPSRVLRLVNLGIHHFGKVSITTSQGARGWNRHLRKDPFCVQCGTLNRGAIRISNPDSDLLGKANGLSAFLNTRHVASDENGFKQVSLNLNPVSLSNRIRIQRIEYPLPALNSINFGKVAGHYALIGTLPGRR